MRYVYISLFLSVFALNTNAQIITTVAGNGTAGYSGDGGQATNAELFLPSEIILDAVGNLYIPDDGNNRVRKVNTAGIITTIAGNGIQGYSGDGGQATNAELYQPYSTVFDVSGNLYISDYNNYCVRKVNTVGIISTFAGTGIAGYSGDGGQATNAELGGPLRLTFDSKGNLYIADGGRIRMINTAGIITTIAGNGAAGYSGDGGQATNAALNYPRGITFDVAGNMYIVDDNNRCVRMVNTSGIITTVVGNGTAGYSGDGGLATIAELDNPIGLVIDALGNLFIADDSNNRIRMVNTAGIITTIVGNGTSGNSGNGGQATSAELNAPVGLAFDGIGNLYIADALNSCIRKVCYSSCSVAGIEQFANNNEQVTVYPNPATNSLQVSLAGNIENSTLILTDMLGNTVKQILFNTQHASLNISDLNEGVYNILIQNSAVRINKKVVIVR